MGWLSAAFAVGCDSTPAAPAGACAGAVCPQGYDCIERACVFRAEGALTSRLTILEALLRAAPRDAPANPPPASVIEAVIAELGGGGAIAGELAAQRPIWLSDTLRARIRTAASSSMVRMVELYEATWGAHAGGEPGARVGSRWPAWALLDPARVPAEVRTCLDRVADCVVPPRLGGVANLATSLRNRLTIIGFRDPAPAPDLAEAVCTGAAPAAARACKAVALTGIAAFAAVTRRIVAQQEVLCDETLGACLPTATGCPNGGLSCGERCVNPLTEPTHCGGCDDACAGASRCTFGACVECVGDGDCAGRDAPLCVGGRCVECAAGSIRCAADGLSERRCGPDGMLGPSTACGAGEECDPTTGCRVPPACSPGAARCGNGRTVFPGSTEVVFVCNEGRYAEVEDCARSALVCETGRCTPPPECTNGEVRCVGTYDERSCVGGRFESRTCPPNQTCQTFGCADYGNPCLDFELNLTRCAISGGGTEQCMFDAFARGNQWRPLNTCVDPTPVCNLKPGAAGQVAYCSCRPGATRCQGSATVQQCNLNPAGSYDWVNLATCVTPQRCVDSGGLAGAACARP